MGKASGDMVSKVEIYIYMSTKNIQKIKSPFDDLDI
jgi:hypothetical protein